MLSTSTMYTLCMHTTLCSCQLNFEHDAKLSAYQQNFRKAHSILYKPETLFACKLYFVRAKLSFLLNRLIICKYILVCTNVNQPALHALQLGLLLRMTSHLPTVVQAKLLIQETMADLLKAGHTMEHL
jgi:hypothetical protein